MFPDTVIGVTKIPECCLISIAICGKIGPLKQALKRLNLNRDYSLKSLL